MRMLFAKRGLAIVMTLFFAVAPAGCGGVGSTESGVQPLRLLDVYPQQGETDVPLDAVVIAAFDDDVFAAGECESSTNVSSTTFSLSACPDGGQETQVSATVTCSRLYESDGVTVKKEEMTTAVLQPDAALDASAKYCIHIDASIKGENTDQLGVSIESSFTTADH